MSNQSPYTKGQEVCVIAYRCVFDGITTGNHAWRESELFVEVDIAGEVEWYKDKDVWLLDPVEVIEDVE